MKKNNNKNNKQAHKRAILEAKRKKAFAKQKHLWDRGIGLYEIYSAEERDKFNKL
jgi:hypothetical protein